MTTANESGSAMEPRNMHTDAEPRVQPLNMHTDVIVTSSGHVVTIAGETDEQGNVGVTLPKSVAGRLKAKATPVHVVARRAISGPAEDPAVVYTLDATAHVSGDLTGGLLVSGSAASDGTKTTVALMISAAALTALRRQRDDL